MRTIRGTGVTSSGFRLGRAERTVRRCVFVYPVQLLVGRGWLPAGAALPPQQLGKLQFRDAQKEPHLLDLQPDLGTKVAHDLDLHFQDLERQVTLHRVVQLHARLPHLLDVLQEIGSILRRFQPLGEWLRLRQGAIGRQFKQAAEGRFRRAEKEMNRLCVW